MRKKKAFSRVTSILNNGAIILPEQVISCLGIRPNDRLLFRLIDEKIVASKVQEDKEGYSVDIKD